MKSWGGNEILCTFAAYFCQLNNNNNVVIHVVRNTYFGIEERFELYNTSEVRKCIEERGGKSLNFPDLADRIMDEMNINGLSITKSLKSLSVFEKAELTNWREQVKIVFNDVLY